jgi:hypothetical protein
VPSAEEEAATRAYAALREGGPSAVRPLLHPYLTWTRPNGATVRGRVNVLALLETEPLEEAPRVTQLRDGQVYRWDSSG